LFLDELTCVPASVQAPLMRLLLERYAGGTKLHPDSAVIGAANPPEQAPGAVELSAASVNRVIKITDFQPTISEIRGFFDEIGEDESRLREEGRDLAATLSVQVDLIDMTPPRASIDAAAPFASPRAWETGLKAYAMHCEAANVGFNSGKDDDELGYALLSGAVGEAKAAAYLGIRSMRKHLPSMDEILANPQTAKVPPERERQIAAVGLLGRVADKDINCSWIYAERLAAEIAAACSRVLMNRPATGAKSSKWFAAGQLAQVKGLARIRQATRTP
jgi:hypothetical protein